MPLPWAEITPGVTVEIGRTSASLLVVSDLYSVTLPPCDTESSVVRLAREEVFVWRVVSGDFRR